MQSLDDHLLSDRPVRDDPALRGPVIVVGIPRSGSSYLSDVLSQLHDAYVFDDLYLRREAAALGADSGPLPRGAMLELAEFLGRTIGFRLERGSHAVPNMERSDVEPFQDALVRLYDQHGPMHWHELQAEFLARLTLAAPATIWGYKCPGEFSWVEDLLRVYPDAHFVYLMRDPTRVMSSYKNLEGTLDGSGSQFHPVAKALYWRAAVRAWLRHEEEIPDRVMLVRFEDLVSDPLAEVNRIADFIGARRIDEVVATTPNTSYNGARPEELSGLDLRILRHLAGAEADALGYELASGSVSLSGIADLARSTFRFAGYQWWRIRQSKRGGWRAIVDRARSLRF